MKIVIFLLNFIFAFAVSRIEDENLTLNIVTSDGHAFIVSANVAFKSTLIENHVKDMLEDDQDIKIVTVPLPNVCSRVFEKILEWMEHYQKVYGNDERVNAIADQWEINFFDIKISERIELFKSADYLIIKPFIEMYSTEIAKEILSEDIPLPDVPKLFDGRVINQVVDEEEDIF